MSENNSDQNNIEKDAKTFNKYKNLSRNIAWVIAVILLIFLLVNFANCSCFISKQPTCTYCQNTMVQMSDKEVPLGNAEIVEIDGVPFMTANGDLTQKSQNEIAAMANSMGPHQIPISINSVPFAATKDAPVNFSIENPSGSDKNILVEVYTLNDGITQDNYSSEADVGQLLYITDGIMPPGSHIECDDEYGDPLPGSDYLITDLEPGEYNCVALFKGYDNSADFNYIGTMPIFLTLTIGE